MKIRYLTSMAGVDHTIAPGDVLNRPAAEAKRLIDAGFAEPVETGSRVAAAIESALDPKAGVEVRGKRLFGAAAKAVLAKLARNAG